MGKARRAKRRRQDAGEPIEGSAATRAALLPEPGLPTGLLAGGTFLIALAGYLGTFARTVTLVDSGELTLACRELGVAHPPGTPLYTLLGHFFTLLPFGSVAARAAFFSSFCAAAASALVAALAVEAGRALPVPRDGRGAPEPGPLADWAGRIGPAAVGLTFAFSSTLWFYASVAEVYALNIALVAAFLYLMLLWGRALREGSSPARADRRLYAAAFVFGLALGVHHATVVLTLPALAVFVLSTAGWRFYSSRRFALAFAAALSGTVAVYAYLPLAARRRPIFDWGDPTTLQRFWWHISAKQYQVNLFSASPDAVLDQLRIFLGWAWQQFTPLGLAGALAGLGILARRQRPLFWLASLLIAADVGFSAIYDIAEDKDAYYLTTYLVLAVALGAAARHLARSAFVRGRRIAAAALLLALAALPAANSAMHRFANDRSHYLLGRHYVEDALAPVPPGGLLLTEDWQFYSPFLYLRHVEGLRPDAEVVDINMVRRSWYVRTYLDRQYPDMMAACAREERDYLEDLGRWEQGRPYDAARLNLRFVTLLNAFVRFHAARDAALTMLPTEEGVGSSYIWVPQGLAMRLTTDNSFHPETPPPLHLADFDGSVFLDEVALGKVRRNYSEMLANRGRYLAAFGKAEDAEKWIRSAISLDPGFDRLYEFLGDLRESQGRVAEAADAYREALRLNPDNPAARRRLATRPGIN